MLIQKTFHLRQDLDGARSQLRDFRGHLPSLEIADVSSPVGGGNVRLAFVSANGFHAAIELETLPSDHPDRTLFHATGGNMDLAGMVEFIPLRAALTEVQLTIEYTIKSPLHSVLDAVTGSVDRFVNRQLRRLQASLASERSEPATRRMAGNDFKQPQFAH